MVVSDHNILLRYDINTIIPNQYHVRVSYIGIARSRLAYYNRESPILFHADLCCVDEDNNVYNITEFLINDLKKVVNMNDGRRLEVLKIDHKNITINNGLEYYINGSKYKVSNMIPIKTTSMDTIYDLILMQYKTPYHAVYNNCHHIINHVINILTNKSVDYDNIICKESVYSKMYGAFYYIDKVLFS